MHLKLLLSTFVLVFLAELGDKTQFAAFGLAASHKSIWPVFFGSALALACSSLLAVLLGSTMGKFLPEQYVKIGSGVLFILFGIFTLFQAFRGEAVVLEGGGLLNRLALESAMQFEEETHQIYLDLAQECKHARAKQVFHELALAEKAHRSMLGRIHDEHQADLSVAAFELEAPQLSMEERLKLGEKVYNAWQHEAKTAQFYEALAKKAHLQSLRSVFAQLADEEESHKQKLQKLYAQIMEA
mgnify:CR=1 FL=1